MISTDAPSSQARDGQVMILTDVQDYREAYREDYQEDFKEEYKAEYKEDCQDPTNPWLMLYRKNGNLAALVDSQLVPSHPNTRREPTIAVKRQHSSLTTNLCDGNQKMGSTCVCVHRHGGIARGRVTSDELYIFWRFVQIILMEAEWTSLLAIIRIISLKPHLIFSSTSFLSIP